MSNKIKHGQFFTKSNPFDSEAFRLWSHYFTTKKIVEPFAGDCDIAKYLPEYNFSFFDIEPTSNKVKQNDSIANFPKRFSVSITNPPYLGKSSAIRRGISYGYAMPDLYLEAINAALNNVDYLAAIIPAAFLSNKYMKDRLAYVDEITTKLFNDTDIPVIVAYFVKKRVDGYILFQDGICKGKVQNIDLPVNNLYQVSFNDNTGTLGLHAIDGTTGKRVRFCKANEIGKKVTSSDRALTKIKVPFKITNSVINELNIILEDYREKTQDTTLTAFRGTQLNGQHRKRISYKIAKQIIGVLN